MNETNLPTTPRGSTDGCPLHSPTLFENNHSAPRTAQGSLKSNSQALSRHALDSVPPSHRGRAEHAVDNGEDLDNNLARLTNQIRNLEKCAKRATLKARVKELEDLTKPLPIPTANHRRPATCKTAQKP